MLKDETNARVEIFNDVADAYDQYRLETPPVVADILTQLLGKKPDRVVDVGAGTGLSTMLWRGRANEIIGIEPNDDMRDWAMKRLRNLSDVNKNISFRKGQVSQTGLADNCVDIVTCSEALHWMEPVTTFNEVNRILRPKGVFAAFGLVGCPTIHSKLETQYRMVVDASHQLRKEINLWEDVTMWPMDLQLDYMKQSGFFSFVKSVYFHGERVGNADQFIGWALNTGIIRGVLKSGVSEHDIGVSKLREIAEEAFGETKVPWFASYRMIVGVTKD